MHTHIGILKFGGTSVGSGERIRRVASIIAHAVNDTEEAFPVVVVSAMSGVTDQLLRIVRHACSGEYQDVGVLLDALKHRHFEVAEKAVQKQDNRDALLHDLEIAFAALERNIASTGTIHLNHYTSAIAAWGERLSVLLVSAAARDAGLKAAPIRQEVIITDLPPDDIHQQPGTVLGANPLTEETRSNAQALISPLVEQRVVPIAAGFIGRTTGGIVMTLGRNGSDYSATVIGAALD